MKADQIGMSVIRKLSEEANEQRSGGSKRVSFMIILGKNSGQKERQIFRRAISFLEAGAGPRARDDQNRPKKTAGSLR